MLNRILDRPITVTMVLLTLVIMGVVSLRLLPVSLIPDVGIPYITVQANEPSLSAREMDESVIKPLREQLMQVGGLQDIVCESKDGYGKVSLSFNHGARMDYLFIEVNEKIDRAMSSLPKMERPKVMKADAGDIPAFFLNVTMPGGGSFIELSRFCKEVIIRRLEQLPEVAMVDMSGGVSEEILITPHERKLKEAGISESQLEAALSAANIRLGALTIRDGEYRYNVRFDAKASSVEDLAAIWLNCSGRLFQVKDLADVSLAPAVRTGLVRSRGEEAIILAVIKQREARMSALKDAIDRQLDSFEEDYPQLSFEITRDQTQLLEYSIRNLLWSILLGVILSCFVIFLFMRDYKSPALVSLTIPSALILSMLLFYLAGISLNIISLSGLLLGVGMMVDNTIILIDSITSKWKGGMTVRDAVLSGTKDVAGPMLSSVLTTCAVFIPLVFVSGMAGALFRDEAFAVTVVLLTSYLVTISVIPVYYYWWYKGQSAFTANHLLGRISFDEPIGRWEQKRLKWWLAHRKVAWGLLVLSAAGVFWGITFIRKERLPRMTQTEAILHLDWNDRLSLEENQLRCKNLEDVLSPFVLQATGLVGAQQFVLEHSGNQGLSELQLFFQCSGNKELDAAEAALDSFLSSSYPHASWSFDAVGNVFDMVFSRKEAPLVARLRPVRSPQLQLEELRHTLDHLREGLPDVPIRDVRVKKEVFFVADAEKMALYDVSYVDLVQALKNALNENRLFSIVQGSRSLPVVMGLGKEHLSAILSQTSLEKAGVSIPLMELMRQGYSEDFRTLVSGPEGSIYPIDMSIKGEDIPRAMGMVGEIVRRTGDFELSFSGSWFSNQKMVREMLFILLVALLLLYLILAAQFESLLQPFIILLEIVIDLFASLAVIWLLGESLNLMSLIGMVVVTGIVINDSILKIDTVNKLREGGIPLYDSILAASSKRMKAIIMTSLTTVLAVAPFLHRGSMGSDLQFPMSLVIIVGMFIGTYVSLFVVPTFYYSLYVRDRS